MKTILTLLMLALAALAVPSASAAVPDPALPAECAFGPMTPGGDTDCRAWAAGCEAHTHMYDVEDALNVYEASCYDCGVRVGGGGLVDCPILLLEPPVAGSAAGVAPPVPPCQAGIAGTDCSVGAMSCAAHAGYRTGSSSYEYAALYCGPPTWSPCEHAYVDTTGRVRSCHVATASSQAAQPCQSGIGSSWCTVSAGGCTATVTAWSAWGDRWAEADCRGGGAGPTCHAEVHTADLLAPQHWCAF